MSEYARFSITLTNETKRKIDAICGDLIPRSRYIESVLKKSFKKDVKKGGKS